MAMYEHGAKKHSRAAAAATSDRRNADRHTFTASAEVVELSSGARFSTRTTDLGPGGCFVDTILPFPVGAKVRVSVRKGQTTFETGGLVVYSQTGLGMGIAFSGMEPQQQDALDSWFAELTGRKQSAPPLAPAHQIHGSATSTPQDMAVKGLVRLMITKGLLTEAEGASILHDPVQDALDSWLGEPTGRKQSAPPLATAHQTHGSATSTPQDAAVKRLVRLMITKGLFTEAEGASILHDPVL